MSDKLENDKKYAFRLNKGTHRENKRTYRPGDIVFTDKDLAKEHNNRGQGGTKFTPLSADEAAVAFAAEQGFREGVPADTQPAKSQAELEKMTVADLRAFAEDNEIPLGTAVQKAEIVKAIFAYLSA